MNGGLTVHGPGPVGAPAALPLWVVSAGEQDLALVAARSEAEATGLVVDLLPPRWRLPSRVEQVGYATGEPRVVRRLVRPSGDAWLVDVAAQAAAQALGVRTADVLGGRAKEAQVARQVAWIALYEAGVNRSEVARIFGFDRSGIYRVVAKARASLEASPALARSLDKVRAAVAEGRGQVAGRLSGEAPPAITRPASG